ncbi:hypothetical protein J3F84DRAFT_287779 [Trichoderma pleuroticola]
MYFRPPIRLAWPFALPYLTYLLRTLLPIQLCLFAVAFPFQFPRLRCLFCSVLCSALLGHSSFAASAKHTHTHSRPHTQLTRALPLRHGHATKYQSRFPSSSFPCLTPSLPSLSLARRLQSLQSPSLSAGSGGHPVIGKPFKPCPPVRPIQPDQRGKKRPQLPLQVIQYYQLPNHTLTQQRLRQSNLLRPYKHCLPRDVPVTYPRTYTHTFAHTPHRDYPKAESDCEIHIPISPLPTSLRAPPPLPKTDDIPSSCLDALQPISSKNPIT